MKKFFRSITGQRLGLRLTTEGLMLVPAPHGKRGFKMSSDGP